MLVQHDNVRFLCRRAQPVRQRSALGNLDAMIETGDLTGLDAWMSEKVWSRASLLETPDLIVHATGEPLSIRAFRTHLERRYLAS